jgi:hypothetical protein
MSETASDALRAVLGDELVLTIRDASGGLIDRSSMRLEEGNGSGPSEWLDRWASVIEGLGVYVELTTGTGVVLGKLTDEGLELTAFGALPLMLEVGGLLGMPVPHR